jgi:WhiB family transcriptional regulator, redox-sensing transcriptional regulator
MMTTIHGHSIWWQEPPDIVLRLQEWRSSAACLGADVELFFPSGPGATYAEARAICARCPVMLDCRRACDRAEGHATRLFGVFGGESPRERAARRRGGDG